MTGLATHFAGAERESTEEIMREYSALTSIPFLQRFIDAITAPVGILNQYHQFVFINEPLSAFLQLPEKELALGKRPGEIFACIHSTECMGGCGTSEYCSVCGAVNAIVKSMEQKTQWTNECRITSSHHDHNAYDLLVTAVPLPIGNSSYIVLSIEDVSDQKRRRFVERIFFHDVINSVSALFSMLELASFDQEACDQEMIVTLKRVCSNLMEEINSYRHLTEAESGELQLRVTSADISDVLRDAVEQARGFKKSRNKNIRIEDSIPLKINTDPVILKRILLNLLKNAVEAISESQTVSTGYQAQKDSVIFYVHNPGYMERDIQLQIFQRSFSTKGLGRGLGSYSVKMHAENYLKGKVSFESSPEEGTTFRVQIPHLPEEDCP